MTIFEDQSGQNPEKTLRLTEERNRALEALKKQPDDNRHQTNLILTSKRLGNFDKALELCSSFLRSNTENEDYIDLYKLVLENAALNEQHYLIKAHWDAFNEMFEEPSISCEKLYNTFQKLLGTDDNHPTPEGPL